jgi:hypothetical protein
VRIEVWKDRFRKVPGLPVAYDSSVSGAAHGLRFHDLGNLLISQKTFTEAERSAGQVAVPTPDPKGGLFEFTFPKPVCAKEVLLVDLDPFEWANITLKDAKGRLLDHSMVRGSHRHHRHPSQHFQFGRTEEVRLGGRCDVSSVAIHLSGSGAIDNLRVCSEGGLLSDPGLCAARIPQPESQDFDRALEERYQRDIARSCSAPELGRCESGLLARLNVDYFVAARRVVRREMSTSQHLAFVQDRERRRAAFRGDEAAACRIYGHDADEDFVPDHRDRCPNTPELTPVDDRGCPVTDFPQGPDIDEVLSILPRVSFTSDPRCVDAQSPVLPSPLGAWRYPNDPSVGKAVWISRDPDTSGCPIWYEIEVELTDGQGPRRATFRPDEDTTLNWITPPAGVVQFNIRTTDGHQRGAWASYDVFTITYRVRAVSGSGKRSPWSNWFKPGNEDCIAGACVDFSFPSVPPIVPIVR